MTTFERIKKVAKERHMSLLEVNRLAGLGTRSIYNWKTKSPTTEALKSVANVLNVSVDYLTGQTSNPKSNPDKPKDIQEILQSVSDDLDDTDALYFLKNGGEELSPTDADMLKIALENTIQISKKLAERRRKDNQNPKNTN